MNGDFHRQRATVMGLGHFGGGAAAARWLARARRQRVIVTDLADEAVLAPAWQRTGRRPIAALHFGGHRGEISARRTGRGQPGGAAGECFLAYRPPQRHVPSTTGIGLFLAGPALPPVIGIPGSNGESTAAAMTAAILQAAGRRAWLGGNIGGSLLDVIWM